MGASNSSLIKYSVEVKPSEDSLETGIYRNTLYPNELVYDLPDQHLETCWDIFQRGKQISGHDHCLGYRPLKDNGELGDYEWFSYNEIEKQALSLGTALTSIIPIAEYPEEVYKSAQKLKVIGLFSKNCIPWFVCEQAANAFNFTLVPLYDTLRDNAILYVFQQTRLTVMAGSMDALKIILNIPEAAKQLTDFISFDNTLLEETLSLAKQYNVKIHFYNQLISTTPIQPMPGTRDSISTLCFTSGTTGNPKGVILTHDNIVSTISGCLTGPLSPDNANFLVTSADKHISYLPAAHVFERAFIYILYSFGGKVGLYSGNVQTLLDDIQALKPTVFISVPRLFNRIHDKVFGGIKKKSALAQHLFNKGISAKLKNFRSDGNLNHLLWDGLVFNKVKNLMGGELRYSLVGGAPLSSSVQECMAVLMSTSLTQGYGLTESFGTSFIGHQADHSVGHVGGPLPSIEFKLRSVLELDYNVNSDPPCGEILVRGQSISKGYFLEPEMTQEVFDKDEWFHTGDIAVLLPSGAIKIIDRRKNIFKLSQGEYVAPETVESVYLQSEYIAQIFVYGNSEKSTLVAIISIDPDVATKWKDKYAPNLTLKDLCQHDKFIQVIEADLIKVVKQGNLRGYEKIKAFHLTEVPFTEEAGLLTPTQKLRRHYAKLTFKSIIDDLYMSVQSSE